MTIEFPDFLMSSLIRFLSSSSIPELPFHAATLVNMANMAILFFKSIASVIIEISLKYVFNGDDLKNLLSPQKTKWVLLLSEVGNIPGVFFTMVMDISVI